MKRIDISMIMDYEDEHEEEIMERIVAEMAKDRPYSTLIDYSLSVTKEYALLRTLPETEGAVAHVVTPIKRFTSLEPNGNRNHDHQD